MKYLKNLKLEIKLGVIMPIIIFEVGIINYIISTSTNIIGEQPSMLLMFIASIIFVVYISIKLITIVSKVTFIKAVFVLIGFISFVSCIILSYIVYDNSKIIKRYCDEVNYYHNDFIPKVNNELKRRPIYFTTICDGKSDNHLPSETIMYCPVEINENFDYPTIETKYDKVFRIKDVHMDKVTCSNGNGYFIGLMYN